MRPAFLLGAKLESTSLPPSLFLTFANRFRTLNDDELNIVLHKLVEYLGHSNPIVTSVAFNEVFFFLTYNVSSNC